MKISIIIPALNEAACIAQAVRQAQAAGGDEIIVVDGGSRDGTLAQAEQAGALVLASPPGRGRQQNAGAAAATGDVLLFLHADNWLAAGAVEQIGAALLDERVICGAFRQVIEAPGRLYRWLEGGNAWRVRRRGLAYGDQGIWLRRETFTVLGGFPETPLLEDVLLMRRLRRMARPVLLPGPLHVSARRWERQGVVRQTLANWMILAAHRAGVSPERLARFYRRHDA